MKASRASVGVALLDGKVHAIGGRTPDGKTLATHEVYDPATDTWSDAAPLPQARDHMTVIAADGKLHAIGGRITSPAEPVALHDVYDPATNTWSAGEPLPTARSGVARTVYKGLIMVLGGELPPHDPTGHQHTHVQ